MKSFMSTLKRARWPRVGARVLLIYMLLLTFAPSAYAQEPAATGDVDDGLLEMQAWYIVDYSGCGLNNLPNTAPDANGLKDRLTQYSWFPIFNFTYPTPQWTGYTTWGNSLAWETDWKRSASGGNEEFYTDNVDLAYFAGHGSQTGFWFGGNRTDCQLTAADAAFSWGTKDNDWIALAACNVLDGGTTQFGNWANAMRGTRLLMGFQTVMADVAYGGTFGWNIRWGDTMTQAWFRAANSMLPSWQVARILAEDGAYFNDRWYNHNSNTVYDNNYSWWTHNVGSAIVAASVDSADTLAQLGGEMPIFEVSPLSLEQAENEYAQVANAFGMTDTTPSHVISAADIFSTLGQEQVPVFVSEDGSLIMDTSAGIYDYINKDTLWNSEIALANAALAAEGNEVRAISQDEAKTIADNFLGQSGLTEADGQYGSTTSDVLAEALNGRGDAAAAEVLETTTNYIVNYDRVLNYVPDGASAAGGGIDFTVVGPGPKQSVYVAATAPTGMSAAELMQDSVLGGQGGWRQISQALAADGSAVMTTMLPTSTIALLFDEAEEHVALDYVPLPTDDKVILNYIPTYYEGPMGMQMDQLIPVYQLIVEATNPAIAGGATQQYEVYIPVNSTYMAPYAEILSPSAQGATTGQTVQLTAADASKPLSELGYDASLNVVLGTGDPDSYTYDWYLNTITDTLSVDGSDGKIGSGMSIPFETPSGPTQDGKPSEVKILLVVTDTLKNGDPKVSQDEIVLTINPVYLPTIGGDE